jgi:hypothetical protein
VLDQTRGADYAVWIIAALLYAYDAARLLAPRELLLVEAGRRRLAASFSEIPFTLMGRVLVFSPLLGAHRGVFIAPWGRPWADPAAVASAVASLDRLRGALTPIRALAAWGLVLLFIIGPGLTAVLGPQAAVLYTAALVYLTAVAAVIVLWARRGRLRLGVARAACFSLEVLVGPAFLPNLVRKFTAAQPIAIDAVQMLSMTASAGVVEQLLGRLATRADELIAESDPDQMEGDELRAYLATVRPSR